MLKFKKLGQNFLTDKNIIKKIVNLENIFNEKYFRNRTWFRKFNKFIVKKTKIFLLIEKDERTHALLKKNLIKIKIKIINSDILNYNLNKNKFKRCYHFW